MAKAVKSTNVINPCCLNTTVKNFLLAPEAATPPTDDFILMEDGSYILMEDGSKIILE